MDLENKSLQAKASKDNVIDIEQKWTDFRNGLGACGCISG